MQFASNSSCPVCVGRANSTGRRCICPSEPPIGQIEITHPIGGKQRLGRHERFPSSRQLHESKIVCGDFAW